MQTCRKPVPSRVEGSKIARAKRELKNLSSKISKVKSQILKLESQIAKRKSVPGLLVLFLACALMLFLAGCDGSLRFAPTEPQKQIAFQTYNTATAIESQGTSPHSPAARQQVTGTGAALSYIGLPDNPNIVDYNTTTAAASQAAGKRPTITDVAAAADAGLSLAAQLAILFGVGGVGFGGKKVLDWIAIAQAKNKALAEIIRGNELFKETADPGVVEAFKSAQSAMQVTPSTPVIVTELKS